MSDLSNFDRVSGLYNASQGIVGNEDPSVARETNIVAPPPAPTPSKTKGPAPLNFMAMVANRRSGKAPESELENDLNSMQPIDFRAKYGDQQTDAIMNQLTEASGVYDHYINSNRSIPEAVWDNFSGAAGLVGSSAVGITGAGVGLVAPQTGAEIADKANKLSSWVESGQSDALNAHRLAQAARAADDHQHDLAAHEADLAAGNGKFIAGLKDVGRQVLTGAESIGGDPMLLEQATIENAGQFAINYALTAGLGAAASTTAKVLAPLTDAERASALLGQATGVATDADQVANMGKLAAQTRILKVAETVNPMISSGVQMGAGSYQQVVGDVLSRSHADLMQSSPVYQTAYKQNIANGLSDDDAQQQAKEETAGETARKAEVMQGILAAATARISHIQEHPISELSTPSKFLSNVLLKEPVEMGLQNTTNQLSRNLAVKENIDPNQDLTENLGEEAGKGIVLGATTAGSMGLAQAALRSPVTMARLAAKGTVSIVDHFSKNVSGASDKAIADANAASPVSGPAQIVKATVAQTNAESDAATVAADSNNNKSATQYVADFQKAMAFDPKAEGVDDPTDPQVGHIAQILNDAPNRPAAIIRLANAVSTETDPTKKLGMASYLNDLIGEMKPFTTIPNEIRDSMDPDAHGTKLIDAYQKIAANIEQAPEVKAALGQVRDLLKKTADDQAPITEVDVNTPAGLNKVNETVLRADVLPETGNVDNINSILDHDEQGRISLSDRQIESLKTSKALLEALKENQDTSTATSKVSSDILTGKFLDQETGTKDSALGFLTKIRDAVASGDTELAKNKLGEMGLFVQHLRNKVEALNEHTVNGNNSPDVKYSALAPAKEANSRDGIRSWFQSKEGLRVIPRDADSLDFAHSVHTDQSVLAHIYNGLVDAYPQLGERKINPIGLHPAIADGTGTELAPKFKSGERKVADFSDQYQKQVADEQKQQDNLTNQNPESVVTKNIKKATAVQKAFNFKAGDETSDAEKAKWTEQAAKQSDKQAQRQLAKLDAIEERTPKQETRRQILSDRLTPKETPVEKPVVVEATPTPVKEEITPKVEKPIISTEHTLGKFERAPEQDKDGNPAYKTDVMEGDKKIASAIIELRDDGKTAFVRWVGLGSTVKEAIDAQREGKTAELGIKSIRPLMQQLKEQFPEVTKVTGDRIDDDGVIRKTQTLPIKPLTAATLDTKPVPAEPVKEVTTGGIKKLYPNLISVPGKVVNYFHEAFATQKNGEPTTRITGIDSPVEKVREVFSSSKSFKDFTGSTVKREMTDVLSKAYKALLAPIVEDPKGLQDRLKTKEGITAEEAAPLMNFGGLMITMRMNLDNFLQGKYKDTTKLNWLLTGRTTDNDNTINSFKNGKVLNLVEAHDDGAGGQIHSYNTHLLESAVMAGLHWFITVGHTTTKLRDDQMESIVGHEIFDDQLKNSLQSTTSVEDVKDGITNAIRQFWGLHTLKTADRAYADGIVEAMSSEVLRAMVNLHMLENQQVEIDPEIKQTVTRLVPGKELGELGKTLQDLSAYPGALADAVVIKPEQQFHFEDNKPQASKTQMGSDTKNSGRQLSAVEKANQTEYRPNLPQWNLYHALGMSSLLDFFGGGSDLSKVNTSHKVTLEGQNITVWTAAEHLTGLFSQMANRAQATGENVADMAQYFGHNMSRVGRLHMLGANNPQASKLVREILLPTWSKLDMTDPQHSLAFGLATAQALGLKVEKNSPEVNKVKTDALLAGPLAPVMKLLHTWVAQQGDGLHTLPEGTMGDKSAFAGELLGAYKQAVIDSKDDLGAMTPLALHALLENARLEQHADKSNFRTGLYLEADGKTNGPINAMVMLANGLFNTNWVRNVRKGGLVLGPKQIALHELSTEDMPDLYATTATGAQHYEYALIDKINSQDTATDGEKKALTNHMDALTRLTKRYLPGVGENDKGFLTLARTIAKSPLTITIYGSGENGIAGNLSNDLLTGLYSHMTEALQSGEKDPAKALFPKSDNPARDYTQLKDDLNQVFGQQLIFWKKESKYFLSNTNADRTPINAPFIKEIDPQNFKASPEHFKTLQSNMKTFLVKPLTAAISDTVGKDVLEASALIQKATNTHSIVYSEAVRAALRVALADRQANDKTYKPGGFLSEEQIDKAIDSVKNLAPLLQTDEQNLLIVKKAIYNEKSLQYNQALNGQYGTAPKVDVPGPVGVGGMPASVLGFGDGRMIQHILNKIHDGIMPVFDGLHMPLDKIKDYSKTANEAAMDVWQNSNPVESVRKAYFKMLGQQDAIHQLLANEYAEATQITEAPDFKGNKEQTLRDNMPLAQQLLRTPEVPNPDVIEMMEQEGGHTGMVNHIMRDIASTADNLNWTAASIDSRHEVLKEMGMSSDQMASAASPFHNGIEKGISEGMSDDAATDLLRDSYAAKMIEAQKKMEPIPAIDDHSKYQPEALKENVSSLDPISDTNFDQSGSDKVETLTPTEMQPNKEGGQSDGIKPVITKSPVSDAAGEEAARKILKGIGITDSKTGVQVIKSDDLPKLITRLKVGRELKTLLSQLQASKGIDDVTVVVGTHEQVQAHSTKFLGFDHIAERNDQGWGNKGELKGFFHENTRTLYLISPTAETLTHELVHAATIEKVRAYYNNEHVPPVIGDAISRVHDLMMQFYNKADDTNLGHSTEGVMQLWDVLNEKLQDRDYAGAANEFMAWGLTNPDVTSDLKATTATFMSRVKEAVINLIKKTIWQGRSVGVDNTVLSQLRFNALTIAHAAFRPSDVFRESTGIHYTADQDSHIADLRTNIDRVMHRDMDLQVEEATKRPGTDPKTERLAIKGRADITLARVIKQTTGAVQSAFTDMSDNETNTFSMLNAMFQTVRTLDPSVMNRMQEHYMNVLNHTKDFTAFMDPNLKEGTPEWERESNMAQAKYKILTGVDGAEEKGSILPTFMALSMTSKSFSDMLNKVPMPKTEKDTAGTLDAVLNNAGNGLMDWLSTTLSGDKRTTNVSDAMKVLTNHLIEKALDERTVLSMGADKFHRATDFADQKMVDLLTYASDAGKSLGERISNSPTKFGKIAGGIVSMVSSLISKKNGELAGDMLIHQLNNVEGLNRSLHALATEMIGRTQSSGKVYDMVKVIKTMSAQIRQNFRKRVPDLLNEKFDHTLTPELNQHMFHGWGKSDATSFMDTHSVEQLFELLSSPDKRADRVKELEAQVRTSDPKNFEIYQRKMKQLAGYMMGEGAGDNLLRNANAVAHLYNERGVTYRPTDFQKEGVVRRQELNVSKQTVQAIDHLTSLYALDHMTADRQKALSDVMKNKPEASKFMLTYLYNTRKGELAKVEGKLLENNHYKGFIPSIPEQGTSLIVDKDSEFGRLMGLGYHRIGDYKGSFLDSEKESRGYYYAPLSGKMAFSQGMVQNIDHTVSGIDSTWGFSTHNTAGRIVDETLVKRIADRAHLDKSMGENLMPLFNERGQVFAYERALDPVMAARREQSQDLSKMLGVWRGRQVEEHMATQMNHTLIDTLKDNYEEGINPASPMGNRKSEYINLFDGKITDAVQKDAIALFSPETRSYIKSKFGKEFMVRKELVDQVIGYRQPSLGDMWTGNTRWSPEVQRAVKDGLTSFLGIDAYKRVMQTETTIQGFMSNMRNNMIVKSITIPARIMMDNVRQLIQRGVPTLDIVQGIGAKLHEVHLYQQFRQKEMDFEADRWATTSPLEIHKINAKLQSIQDSYERMSIYPLIKHGDLNTIGELEDENEMKLSSGRVSEWLEQQIDKAPTAIQTPLKYAIVARDTSLYKGLERLMEYGDFIAKGIYYDHMTKREKISSEEALSKVSEEYVNFDWKAGRTRNYLDTMGITWFLAYKLRIAKIALSMMRDNPFGSLMTAFMPGLNETGSVIDDNIFGKILSGHLGYSLGPMNALKGLNMGPFWSLGGADY
jgi:hypothetical protein